jgi:hypothetical protein
MDVWKYLIIFMTNNMEDISQLQRKVKQSPLAEFVLHKGLCKTNSA